MAETTLIYGATDSWKTTNLGFAAMYMFEISGGKPVRLVSSDGGQYKPIQHLIDAGVIIPLWIPSCSQPLIMYRKLALGFWPQTIEGGMMRGELLDPPGQNKNMIDNVSGYLVEGLTSMSDRLMEDLRANQRKIGEDSVGNFQLTMGQGTSAITEKFANN